MRIGVLTFHRTNNYGASLQAYALCHYLQKLGVDAELIDYQNRKMEEDYIKAYSVPKGFKRKLRYYLFFSRSQDKRKKAFSDFAALTKTSHKHYSDNFDMSAAASQYDYIFVGSDQVWNYHITGFDWNFYLSFAPSGKRVAYAASIGLEEFDEEYVPKIKEILDGYYRIGVRENQAVELLNHIGVKNCNLVADPTLLLDKREWQKIVGNPIVNGKYILVYSFGMTKTMKDFTEELAKMKSMKIVHIDGSPKNIFSNLWYSARGVGPQEWVNLFYYASAIVTNSFHGTVFSVNFGKEFYTELLPPPAKVNSRLTNILKELDLEGRIIDNGLCEEMGKDIDYETINIKLKEMINRSTSFINEVIYGKK